MKIKKIHYCKLHGEYKEWLTGNEVSILQQSGVNCKVLKYPKIKLI